MLHDEQTATFKEIEKLFLAYPEETPEKEYCKIDTNRRNNLQKWGIALTTAANNNLDLKILLANMGQKKEAKKHYSFDTLFEEYQKATKFIMPESIPMYLLERSRYNFLFNVWLQDKRGWEYGNENQYTDLLTFENFEVFLQDENIKKERASYLNSLPENSFRIFTENFNSLRSSFRIKRKATKEDTEEIPRLKEGDIIEYNPPYTKPLEAFTLLTQYYAKAYLELEKHLFVQLYKSWNTETIKAEIAEIENFIKAAESQSLSAACKLYGTSDDTDHFVYRRLMGGFYENLEVEKYPLIGSIGNAESRVYGRYFHFHSFLKQVLIELNAKDTSPGKELSKKAGNKVIYSQRQIAIAYFFLGEQITDDNAAGILKNFSDTQSVQKLLSKRVSKASDLTGISENKTKDTKHLKDLEAAKRLISGKKNKKAETSIKAVITAFTTKYNSAYS